MASETGEDEVKRRSFLKGLGVFPFSAKAVAQEAVARAEKEAMDLSRILVSGNADAANMTIGFDPSQGKRDEVKSLLSLVNGGRVPKWLKDRLRHQSKYINAIHPDIACLRSASLTAKMRMQQRRNYLFSLRHIEHQLSDDMINSHELYRQFAERTGIYL